MKALVQEWGLVPPRIHDLEDLLHLLLPSDSTLGKLRRPALALNPYAVDYRYPGVSASTRQMQSALRCAERIRRELRARLGLPP